MRRSGLTPVALRAPSVSSVQIPLRGVGQFSVVTTGQFWVDIQKLRGVVELGIREATRRDEFAELRGSQIERLRRGLLHLECTKKMLNIDPPEEEKGIITRNTFLHSNLS